MDEKFFNTMFVIAEQFNDRAHAQKVLDDMGRHQCAPSLIRSLARRLTTNEPTQASSVSATSSPSPSLSASPAM